MTYFHKNNAKNPTKLMINELRLFHFPAENGGFFVSPPDHFFCLKTCQRTLYLGLSFIPNWSVQNNSARMEFYSGEGAYQFLLETICGLKSKIQGENEIVGQFKEAFANYLKKKNRHPKIVRVLEKLTQDGKKIRTNYLLNIGQYSYTGLAKKFLEEKIPQKNILIIGNGSLSRSLVKVLKKKYQLFVTGRNQKKIEIFSNLNATFKAPWLDFEHWSDFPFIINTVGAEEDLIDQAFFQSWMNKHPNYDSRQFIDFGHPSILNTSYTQKQGILRLKDIFHHGDNLKQDKKIKLAYARTAIEELTYIRAAVLKRQYAKHREQRFA
jgi:glutamyl-tRNA reductase